MSGFRYYKDENIGMSKEEYKNLKLKAVKNCIINTEYNSIIYPKKDFELHERITNLLIQTNKKRSLENHYFYYLVIKISAFEKQIHPKVIKKFLMKIYKNEIIEDNVFLNFESKIIEIRNDIMTQTNFRIDYHIFKDMISTYILDSYSWL